MRYDVEYMENCWWHHECVQLVALSIILLWMSCTRTAPVRGLYVRQELTENRKLSLTNFDASSKALSSVMSATKYRPVLPSAPRLIYTCALCKYCRPDQRPDHQTDIMCKHCCPDQCPDHETGHIFTIPTQLKPSRMTRAGFESKK